MKPTLFDYSNEPDLSTERLGGFDMVVLSPRVNERQRFRCEELRAENRLAFWVQPFISTWRGELVGGWDWDDRLKGAVDDKNVLKDAAGNWLSITGHDISGVFVLDLRVLRVRNVFQELLVKLNAPILFDYGSFDLAWEPNLKAVEPHVWPEWGRRYTDIKLGVADDQGAWLQTRKTELPIAQSFEKLNRLTSVQQVFWRTASYHQPIIMWDTNQIPTDTMVSLAHILDANLGVIHKVYDERHPIDLSLGERSTENLFKENNIILAYFRDGVCLLNAGQAQANYRGIALEAGEGKVYKR